MPGKLRCQVVDESVPGYYHAIARCVRQEFLCGTDSKSGRDYSHRKSWIEQRIRYLASVMAIEICFISILSNHFHLVLRNRPDVVDRWDDREVMIRACQLFPSRFKPGNADNTPTEVQLQELIRDERLVASMRKRLSSLSWFMRQLCQSIARRANTEDGKTGHFWQGRFRCVPLLDDGALLLCAIYIDLNHVRAGMATTPEESQFTSVRYRAMALTDRAAGGRDTLPDSFLSPLGTEMRRQEGRVPAGKLGSSRVSDEPLLDMTTETYLCILDWAASKLDRSKHDEPIPSDVQPILARLGLSAQVVAESSRNLTGTFGVAVGNLTSLTAFGSKLSQRWLKKTRSVAKLYSSA